MSGRLNPGAVAKSLFGIDPDRDERASQLCSEALLTIVVNGYQAPRDTEALVSPKRERFAVRSLALGWNFLEGEEAGRVGDEDTSPHRYGELLAKGIDFRGSSNLGLARDALQGLIDPGTHRGQPGGWLLFPFHESLLWYDGRRDRGRWRVRKVYMRGSGITLARMLLAPVAGEEVADLAREAVGQIQRTLQSPSPIGSIAGELEAALPQRAAPRLEDDERDAWDRGGDPSLASLTERVCRHAEGVMLQGVASGPARLWQLRTVLALDMASHALGTAWSALDTPARDRYLLIAFHGPARADDRVRQRSENVYQQARQRLRRATVRTLAAEMARVSAEVGVDWDEELENRRQRMDQVIEELRTAESQADFDRLAARATETADYGRASEGFRVLLDAIGMLAGTGQYRYLTGTPELLASLVGSLSAEMPMSSTEFFNRLFEDWNIVIGQEAAAKTALAGEVDGAELERNARRAERLLSDAGLAVGLSDRTVVVGERAARISR